ncbi:MAG: hypothetical protein IR526_02980 [Bordetella sp.]|nr:MAG: hypothetical protein IR526_02980 [Bordetella sp.]
MLWKDKKLAGLLVETLKNSSKFGYSIIIGIGININNSSILSNFLGHSIANLSEITNINSSGIFLAKLVCMIANSWLIAISEFEKTGFSNFCLQFNKLDALLNRPVNVMNQGNILYTGIARGVDKRGQLILQTKSGLKFICIGEISIRIKK